MAGGLEPRFDTEIAFAVGPAGFGVRVFDHLDGKMPG
jgi:hypothetical protein